MVEETVDIEVGVEVVVIVEGAATEVEAVTVEEVDTEVEVVTVEEADTEEEEDSMAVTVVVFEAIVEGVSVVEQEVDVADLKHLESLATANSHHRTQRLMILRTRQSRIHPTHLHPFPSLAGMRLHSLLVQATDPKASQSSCGQTTSP